METSQQKPVPLPSASTSKKIDIKTGGAFSSYQLQRQLTSLHRHVSSLSGEDLNAFGEIVKQHAQRAATGSEFTYSQKMALKRELSKLPSLSYGDKQKLRKIIDSG